MILCETCVLQGNPNNAHGESVSFGRFMTESLAWEKWSTFSSHNRYVEEAERISRPGSVAEKKAFFESHYNKLAAQKAAAALLEQEAEVDSNTIINSHNEENAITSNLDTSLPQSQNNNVDGTQPKKEMLNQLKDVEKVSGNIQLNLIRVHSQFSP